MIQPTMGSFRVLLLWNTDGRLGSWAVGPQFNDFHVEVPCAVRDRRKTLRQLARIQNLQEGYGHPVSQLRQLFLSRTMNIFGTSRSHVQAESDNVQ